MNDNFKKTNKRKHVDKLKSSVQQVSVIDPAKRKKIFMSEGSPQVLKVTDNPMGLLDLYTEGNNKILSLSKT